MKRRKGEIVLTQEPTVLICIGATKAGTSWVHDYLSSHPQVSLRAIKEMHYFDALDLGFGWVANNLRAGMARDLERLAALPLDFSERREWLEQRVSDATDILDLLASGQVDFDAYLSYLRKDAGEARVVGDVTPGYALLSEERLSEIAKMSPDVRVLFIMRDPVDRLWSHVRMIAKRQLKAGEDITKKARRILNRTMRHGENDDITARGDYPVIVEKLRRAVPEEKLCCTFAENLISETGVKDLCKFLGIDYVPAELEKRVHQGALIEMNDGQKQAAHDYLAPHYAYVEKTFGPLPARWQANMARI